MTYINNVVPMCPICQHHKIILAPKPPDTPLTLPALPVYCSECTWLGRYDQLQFRKL